LAAATSDGDVRAGGGPESSGATLWFAHRDPARLTE
jgi:hypothetical protein